MWHFRWNVQIDITIYHTHVITLPATLKQALILPDPVYVLIEYFIVVLLQLSQFSPLYSPPHSLFPIFEYLDNEITFKKYL